MKYEAMSTLVAELKDSCSQEQLCALEIEIMKALDFKVARTTHFSLVELYLGCIYGTDLKATPLLQNCCKILDALHFEPEFLSGKFSFKTVAAAVVALGTLLTNLNTESVKPVLIWCTCPTIFF